MEVFERKIAPIHHGISETLTYEYKRSLQTC